MEKSSGILLAISSLPNKYGIGSFGEDAKRFVDFLKKSKIKYWQILPLGPTSIGDSPYQSYSSYAINPYFIDLDWLVSQGLLTNDDLKDYIHDTKYVDYGYIFNTRFNILQKAYNYHNKYQTEFDKFKEENKEWLDGYAVFMMLHREHENKGIEDWYPEFKFKVGHAMDWALNEYKDEVDYFKFIQYLAYKEYFILKDYANKNGIKIIGDIPFYCAYDSHDLYDNREMFQLNPDLTPKNVAGCPPDFFSENGQLWGNPCYDFEKQKLDKFKWYKARINHQLKLYDVLRIDHFRAFAGYYEIPYGMKNAKIGRWAKGPGYELFKGIDSSRIIAENLGFITPDVKRLLTKTKFLGINVFQFELGDGIHSPIKKESYSNSVLYSGTHDNECLYSFYINSEAKYKKLIDKLCNISVLDNPNFKIIEYLFKKDSPLVIIPMQDYLSKDLSSRMNTPSTPFGNWCYRVSKEELNNELSKCISNLITRCNR